MANPAIGHQGKGLPSVNVPFVDKDGKITSTWLHYLLTLQKSSANAAQLNPLLGSPFTFNALRTTQLFIIGGTITSVNYSRDGINFFPTGSLDGPINLNQGDQLQIVYTVEPIVVALPM